MDARVFIVLAILFVVVIGFALMFEARAQDAEPVRYEGDHLAHETELAAYYDSANNVVWIWNPDNATITYGKESQYVADPIHVGHWDVIPHRHEGKHSINADLHSGIDHAHLVMARHLLNVTDTQAAVIANQSATIEALRNQTASLEAEVEKVWVFYTATNKIAFANAERVFQIEEQNAALNATVQEQQKTIAAMAERIEALERLLNEPPEPVPDAPLPPPET